MLLPTCTCDARRHNGLHRLHLASSTRLAHEVGISDARWDRERRNMGYDSLYGDTDCNSCVYLSILVLI